MLQTNVYVFNVQQDYNDPIAKDSPLCVFLVSYQVIILEHNSCHSDYKNIVFSSVCSLVIDKINFLDDTDTIMTSWI